tara:strand:+ start:1229 stop:2110 length:882 start_codon:yes stop_codon:yes gene_type:complete
MQFNLLETTNSSINNALDTYVYANPVVSSVLTLFLVLYAGLAAPKLPKKIATLFGNEFFRIIILVLIAYMASKDASLAIISAVALVVSLQTLNYHEANEVVASTIADEASKVTDTEEQVYDESEDVEEDHHEDEHEHDDDDEDDKSEVEKKAPEASGSRLSTESDSKPAQVDFSRDSVSDEEESEEAAPVKSAPSQLPQGNDIVDGTFANFMQKNNELSSKVSDNTNEIKEIKKSLEASIKASSQHDHTLKEHEHGHEHNNDHEEKPETDSESKVTGVKNTVSAYGGGSYASF